MADKFMYISNDDNPSVDYNEWLKHLETQLNEPTYKKTLLQNLGASVTDSPMSPGFNMNMV